MRSQAERVLGSIVEQMKGQGGASSRLGRPHSTELLKIGEVEARARMKRSNIYRLIKLGLFPAPIHLGGSKWRATEVDECVQRLIEERDLKQGGKKFTPRPAILSAASQGGSNNTVEPAINPASTVRMLPPELAQALRLLKIDIPELYLDPAAWNVSLAVVQIQVQPLQPAKKRPRG
jgi:predicted DNA-binding transcriptional regulator AlpA